MKALDSVRSSKHLWGNGEPPHIPVITDATFDPSLKRGAYAYWAFDTAGAPVNSAEVVPGDLMDSCSAELAAVVLSVTDVIGRLRLRANDIIVVYSDCEYALDAIQGGVDFTDRRLADFQRVQWLESVLQERQITLKLRHVKGHRKDVRASVSGISSINHWCDRAARAALAALDARRVCRQQVMRSFEASSLIASA